jgi:ubiquitin carboxyl-terminal hydrolase 36/42
MNSVLQCLTYTVPLEKHLTNHHKTCKRCGFCSACALELHIKKSLSSRKPFTPKPFVLNLKKIAKHFRNGRQEDSHEFLRFLIDGIHDLLKKGEKSIIQDVFGGIFQSQVVCLKCKTKSNKFDPLMDISLDIKNCDSIEQALFRYSASENLNKGNQYKCANCNMLRDAQKRVTIKKSPQILTIQLKRFGFCSSYGSKVTRCVKYPEELKLQPFMSEANVSNTSYQLYGVLVHAGHTCNSGHYYSFVRNRFNSW